MRWVCPHCDREFGRARQAHVCVPGGTLAETFAGRPPVQREMYERLAAHLATLGPVHADCVGVGVFLKRERTLAEVRPMARSLNVLFVFARRVEHARIERVLRASADRLVHVVKLRTVDDVDEQVLDWLTEAYQTAG